ncbi:hypothetical protein BCEP4_1540008 [Burkholderia cepacia]|nr:hypothetical protein BCEP4_1540008 [Burkholderia cepacia]
MRSPHAVPPGWRHFFPPSLATVFKAPYRPKLQTAFLDFETHGERITGRYATPLCGCAGRLRDERARSRTASRKSPVTWRKKARSAASATCRTRSRRRRYRRRSIVRIKSR